MLGCNWGFFFSFGVSSPTFSHCFALSSTLVRPSTSSVISLTLDCFCGLVCVGFSATFSSFRSTLPVLSSFIFLGCCSSFAEDVLVEISILFICFDDIFSDFSLVIFGSSFPTIGETLDSLSFCGEIFLPFLLS